MDRDRSLEYLKVTEAAAIAAAKLIGNGDRKKADALAVEAMRKMFDQVPIAGTVVIGEGEIDQAPMLYIGEAVGTGQGPEVDIAVDPLEGTNLVAKGMPGAIVCLAVAPKDCFLHAPDMYKDKIAVGPEAAGKIDITRSVADNIRAVALAKNKKVEDITVICLERDRHDQIIAEARAIGARVHLIADGDVAAALACAAPDSGIDIMLGIGGAPEGVLAAAGLKSLGGELQGKLAPRNEKEIERAISMGTDPEKILLMDDLVKSEDVQFISTGVTSGDFLQGLKYAADGSIITYSIIINGRDKKTRYVQTIHR